MRHWDHKFEWSQQEFQSWCLGIVDRYPSYEVAFGGVGAPPKKEAAKNVGYATQIASFFRKDFLKVRLNTWYYNESPDYLLAKIYIKFALVACALVFSPKGTIKKIGFNVVQHLSKTHCS